MRQIWHLLRQKLARILRKNEVPLIDIDRQTIDPSLQVLEMNIMTAIRHDFEGCTWAGVRDRLVDIDKFAIECPDDE